MSCARRSAGPWVALNGREVGACLFGVSCQVVAALYDVGALAGERRELRAKVSAVVSARPRRSGRAVANVLLDGNGGEVVVVAVELHRHG